MDLIIVHCFSFIWILDLDKLNLFCKSVLDIKNKDNAKQNFIRSQEILKDHTISLCNKFQETNLIEISANTFSHKNYREKYNIYFIFAKYWEIDRKYVTS